MKLNRPTKHVLILIIVSLFAIKFLSSFILVSKPVDENSKEYSLFTSNSKPAKFWRFLGEKTDFSVEVFSAINSFGIKSATKVWDLTWTTENWNINDVRLSDNSREKAAFKQKKRFINVIPGIPSREELALQHQKCIEYNDIDDCDYTPITFFLPQQAIIWKQYSRILDSSTLWVLRSLSKQGNKQIVTSSFNIDELKGNWTIQSYWKNLMLFKGKKFDFRAWVLISSIDPLRIWMFHSGIPRVSPSNFLPDLSFLNDRCMHLTEFNISCDQENTIIYFNTQHPKFQKELSRSDGSSYINSSVYWSNRVWESAKSAVVKSILMAYPKMLHNHRELEKRGIKIKRFAWLAPQFIADETGRSYLLSLNINGNFMAPNWAGRYPFVDKYFDKPISDHFKDAVKIVGITGYQRDTYLDELQLVSKFSQQKQLEKTERESIRSLVDEQQISENCKWERIFPQLETLHHYIPFFSIVENNQTNLGISGSLNQITWEYLHFRKQIEREMEINKKIIKEEKEFTDNRKIKVKSKNGIKE